MLERDDQLARLVTGHRQVAAGADGACIVLSGDAGIGKSTLVQAFVRTLPANVPVLLCGCEDLFTPRPLGPLVDLADRFPPSVARALEQGLTYNGLFPAMLRYFKESAQPCVFVVEDLHWADAGTLDLVRYLGRRLFGARLLLLLTHREDGLDPDHPLRSVLGDLPSATSLRLSLAPLSRAAVQSLAHAARRDGAALFAATGGNPFYVSELLAAPDHGVPSSVRDAVLAKLARLPPAARELSNWISLFPGRAERPVLEQVAQPQAEAIDTALRSGLVQTRDGAFAFRHEIARHAVHEALLPERRSAGHAAIFRALSAAGAEPARCVHHAEAAGLLAAVGELAPRAAQQAAATGSHREAARLLGVALEYSAPMAPAARAQLLESQAHECMLVGQHRVAIGARSEACAIWRTLGATLRVGDNLRWLARLHWFEEGSSATTRGYAQAAIEVLESLPPQRELALAYSTLSHLHLVGEDMQEAQRWGVRAITLAETLDDAEALSHSLNNVGSARLRLCHDPKAWELLSRSLEVALTNGLEQDAARAYNNLFILSVFHHDFTRGLHYAQDGISYSETKGLDIYTVRIRIRRAFARIVMGQWEQAEADLADVAQRHTPSPMESATHAFVASILALRRGDQEAALRLATAVRAIRAARVEIWFISTAAALAEAAWLAGRVSEVEAIVRPTLSHMIRLGDHWRAGELAAWLVRIGAPVGETLPVLPLPYALELRGDWRAAAEEWNRLGCPYDRALALLAGDHDAMREALAIFEALGAAPGAERVREMLRERGARGVPRGPQPRTRGDPLGLTAREREVFELARRGVATADIAARLHRSERTVEHHVAAVYRKLGVSKRAELMAQHPSSATSQE